MECIHTPDGPPRSSDFRPAGHPRSVFACFTFNSGWCRQGRPHRWGKLVQRSSGAARCALVVLRLPGQATGFYPSFKCFTCPALAACPLSCVRPVSSAESTQKHRVLHRKVVRYVNYVHLYGFVWELEGNHVHAGPCRKISPEYEKLRWVEQHLANAQCSRYEFSMHVIA